MDELRGKGESISSGIGDSGGVLRFGHSGGGKDGRRRRRLGNLCGPRVGFVQTECGFAAAVVGIGIDMEDFLVRAGEGSSRRGRAGLVRRALWRDGDKARGLTRLEGIAADPCRRLSHPRWFR